MVISCLFQLEYGNTNINVFREINAFLQPAQYSCKRRVCSAYCQNSTPLGYYSLAQVLNKYKNFFFENRKVRNYTSLTIFEKKKTKQ